MDWPTLGSSDLFILFIQVALSLRMRDKSRRWNRTPTPLLYSSHVLRVRCVSLALSPLGYDFRCRAVRCDSQWDDASFKSPSPPPPAVRGFRDYSCGCLWWMRDRQRRYISFFPLPISFTNFPACLASTMHRAHQRDVRGFQTRPISNL